jgi:two-component system NtrC family response regulator/two-component system response regulator HydG
MLNRRHMDLVLLDLHMPRASGLDVLRSVRATGSSSEIALMSGAARVEDAVEAIKLGASEYFSKPLDMPRVRALMAAMRQRFLDRNIVLDADATLAERLEVCGMIGRSPAMRELFSVIHRLAPHARTVLVTGETGTGKELVARALHELGPRKSKRLVTVNCSAVVETLFESELFGHVRGAFTGATADKTGVFEAANGGTVFLDEAGELPAGAQAKLLRTLENGEVQRVGAVETRKVDVRVIAATNRSLQDEVKQGRFREDLFYRLNVMAVPLPPLRDRKSDIPLLIEHYIEHFNTEFRKRIRGVSPSAMTALQEHSWPGNVRELRNAVERAMLLAESNDLNDSHFPITATGDAALSPAMGLPAAGLNLEALERSLVVQALERSGWNQTKAAILLGLNRDQIRYRIEKFDLHKPA